MVETVRAMFPDIPTAAIQADLQRTGSVETTVDNVLRDGGLPVPVSAVPSQPTSPSPSNHATNNTTSSSSSRKQHDNLIQRYKLDPAANGAVEPPKVWEADPTKRQHALQQRKAFMVMQARQKLMDKQKQKEQAAAAVVEDTPAATEKSFDDLSVEELNTLTPEQRRQHMLQAYEKKMMQA
ncbi:hypothetical protein BC940DRAFT_316369 [Gongronella butleri]|nr:hypothetical protein BC940DRAFT_316369 [Gongronella butleri]